MAVAHAELDGDAAGAAGVENVVPVAAFDLVAPSPPRITARPLSTLISWSPSL